MKFGARVLARDLEQIASQIGPPARYVVAFSGGMDSSVLLHALNRLPGRDKPIIAVHVNHQLQPAAAEFAAHCAQIAATLSIEIEVLAASVPAAAGGGPEASAREARYAVLGEFLQPGDWLLSAHHQDDQAETLLLNLLRTSGPAGLAGIPRSRPLGPGHVVRPLLEVPRAALQAYASQFALEWIEDPTNRGREFDRNYLRHEVLPVLEARWPDAARRLRRSANRAREASELLDDLADIDLATLGPDPSRLSISGLLTLAPARQRNVLRAACRRCRLPTPQARHLAGVLDELIPARGDAEPEIAWPGASVRRYRDQLYLLAPSPAFEASTLLGHLSEAGVELPAGLGRLDLEPAAGEGLDAELAARGLELRTRSGGEMIRPMGHAHTRKLKKLLQDAAIVPWMRDRLPLVYAGERLVAVADLWLAADAASDNGVAIRWHGRPALH